MDSGRPGRPAAGSAHEVAQPDRRPRVAALRTPGEVVGGTGEDDPGVLQLGIAAGVAHAVREPRARAQGHGRGRLLERAHDRPRGLQAGVVERGLVPAAPAQREQRARGEGDRPGHGADRRVAAVSRSRHDRAVVRLVLPRRSPRAALDLLMLARLATLGPRFARGRWALAGAWT